MRSFLDGMLLLGNPTNHLRPVRSLRLGRGGSGLSWAGTYADA
jgi:hypothetical protein